MQSLNRVSLSTGVQARFATAMATQGGMARRPATPDAFTRTVPRFGGDAEALTLPPEIQAKFDAAIEASDDGKYPHQLMNSDFFDIPADPYVAGLQHVVQACQGMETLYLLNQHLTDVGLKVLAGLPKLETLFLDQTAQVTDAGLRELASLNSLKTLYLFSLPRITNGGYDALKAQRPDLGIRLSDCAGFIFPEEKDGPELVGDYFIKRGE